MFMLRTSSLILIVSSGVLCLVLASTSAQATPLCECPGQERQLTVKGKSQAFPIGLLKNGDIRVHVPSGVDSLTMSRTGPLLMSRSTNPKDKQTFYLRFDSGTSVGDVASVRIFAAGGFEARLDIEYVGALAEATGDLTVMHISEVERERALVAPAETQVQEDADARRRLERITGIPLVDRGHRQNGPISVHVHHAEWEREQMYVYFTADSHVVQPRMLEAIAALDADGQPIPGTRVYFDKEETEGTPEEITSIAPGVKPVKVLIEGHGRRKGLIVIPAAADVDRDLMGLRLYGEGQSFLTQTILKGWRLMPVTEEQWEREQRAKQTTVSVRLLGGGFWTTAGDDLGGLDGTTMAGVAVRIQKGYQWGGAFEAEIVGARSSDARFQDVPWGGMIGEVSRSATLGRASAGFAMRFGDRYVSSARVGVGLQVASYNSTFSTDITPMPGPGDGFEVDAVVSVGAGFDARLGENWGLGASTTLTSTFYKGPRSLEAGLHLGYGWN